MPATLAGSPSSSSRLSSDAARTAGLGSVGSGSPIVARGSVDDGRVRRSVLHHEVGAVGGVAGLEVEQLALVVPGVARVLRIGPDLVVLTLGEAVERLDERHLEP